MLKLVFWVMLEVFCASTLFSDVNSSGSRNTNANSLKLYFKLPSNKGLYLLAKQISQPCPFRKTLVNASYMLVGQANRITWEVSK